MRVQKVFLASAYPKTKQNKTPPKTTHPVARSCLGDFLLHLHSFGQDELPLGFPGSPLSLPPSGLPS